ncbi:hypothetical protein CYMTET_8381 [Cymbomonas tetramitiformis]|uniref:Uncharacterized protein n=1 Tax=Cymbomonas tetramitiformis TaxID=36881 RepID=A0AAE0GTC8_9CHLO|nr:hypothetical protein CYMTET_8381 [Cymbomonas tetramitiformis]
MLGHGRRRRGANSVRQRGAGNGQAGSGGGTQASGTGQAAGASGALAAGASGALAAGWCIVPLQQCSFYRLSTKDSENLRTDGIQRTQGLAGTVNPRTD